MKKVKKERKMNNRGFSLVELIIVIAIMAILAGALAPQFVKYVAKSREAVDNQNIDLLISTTNSVLADPDVVPQAGTIKITGPTNITFSGVDSSFQTAFTQAVGSKYPVPKQKGKDGFLVTISGSATDGWTVTCETTSPTP